MFKFYLDDNLVSDPINWNDFEENIVRDDVIKGLLPRYDIKLNFNAGGYDYIYGKYTQAGYCQLIELRIDISCDDVNYTNYFNGYIFVSDCIFSLNRCIVECSVIDDNYGARIYNNKSIKTYLDTGKSKNGVTITNATQQSMQFFSPWNVSYFAQIRKPIMLYDAFRFLVDFMTDGLVAFESDYLDYNTLVNVKNDQANKVSIVTGEELRLFQHDTTPFISFDDLFKEVNKKFPIMFTIYKNAYTGGAVIKIENEDYFYSTNNSITIANIPDIKQSFSNEKLYANIKFDAPYKDYDGVLYHFPQTRFFSFLKEEYYFATECNTDNTLDLTADWISDSNIIEGVVDTDTGNDGYDEDIFLIEGMPLTPTTLARADFSPISGGQPWYYNQHLQNNFIAERHSLANNIALYLNNAGDGFMATKTVDAYLVPVGSPVTISTSVPYESGALAFQDDSVLPNFDTNGNYNNTVYKYTSPANGVYTFETSVIYEIASIAATEFTVYLRYDVYDSGNVLQYTYYSNIEQTLPASANVVNTLTSIDGFFIPATYYVNVKLGVKPEEDLTIFNILALLTAKTGSYFKTTSIENGGGVYQENEPADYFISKYNFDYPLDKTSYDTIKTDLSQSIVINYSPTTNKTCWIRKIDRKLATGETKFELISSINNSL